MGRKPKGQKTPSYGFSEAKQKMRHAGKRIESYEDTIEEGGVDDFMFKRDQIMFDTRDELDDEDIAKVGHEVMALPSRNAKSRREPDNEAVTVDEDDDDDEAGPSDLRKRRKEKSKPDMSKKGRFGKPIVDSDEEEGSDASGSGTGSSEDEEGWGRSYYSMPSSRREKQKEGEYDEKREEDRELEEREVRRLQRKARESLRNEDFGLDDDALQQPPPGEGEQDEGEEIEKPPAPETTDPEQLVRYMEVYEPVKLALAREWPLVVKKLEKTQRGIRKMEAEKEGQLHRGLGWLHYQTLLAYASTLAFYIHLATLPPANRPDVSTHPILSRLLELKKALLDLESLDFDAASVSGNALVLSGWASDGDDEGIDVDEEEAELRELIKNKKELIARLIANPGGGGVGVMPGEEGDDGVGKDDEWEKAGLEDGELDDLLADAEIDGFDSNDNYIGSSGSQINGVGSQKMKEKGAKKPSKKAKKGNDVVKESTKSEAKSKGAKSPSFTTLSEPEFFASSSPKQMRKDATASEMDTDLGDPSALLSADAEDKDRRKRSLAFHTAKIASTAARRAAAREKRMSGDEDVPYRDRQKARDAVLRRQGVAAEGEDLDGREMTGAEKKRAREIRDEDDGAGENVDEAGGEYYDLVKRARLSAKSARQSAHETAEAARMEELRQLDAPGGDGPRSLTRAIEKNRGLTPRRNKAGRNPRVKKRQAYEKAKQKVGSQRAVFKGGQASLGGKYAGEKTGISTVVKSRRF